MLGQKDILVLNGRSFDHEAFFSSRRVEAFDEDQIFILTLDAEPDEESVAPECLFLH